MTRFFFRLLGGLLLALGAAHAFAADHVAVAAAANLAYVLEPLRAEFAKADPAVVVTSEIGASGSLVAQINQGAPYDVFLSADLGYPRQLAASGGAVASSLVVFAQGKLVLWTVRPGLDLISVVHVIRNPLVRKIAIANPQTAPYGRAAMEVLAKLGLTDIAAPKTVTGENISQTAQYVSTGNVDVGFVALSLVVSPKLRELGRWIEVPTDLYAPIDQGAILTSRGAHNAAARRYLAFLRSPEARPILVRFGYGVP